MTAPLSQDIRKRVARVVASGSSARKAARRFDISPSAAIKLMRRVRKTGSTAPAKIGGYRRPLLEGHVDYLRALTETHKGITLAEIAAKLAERGVTVSSSAIWRMLRQLGLRHKKSL